MTAALFSMFVSNHAYAQAGGSSDEIYISGTSFSASNVSLTGADGKLWFAVEHIDPTGTLTNPGLRLVRYDVGGGLFSAKTIQSIGALTGNAIYPSLRTWGTIDDVYVVGKVDPVPPVGTLPHMRVYTQDRDSFLRARRKIIAPSGTRRGRSERVTHERIMPSILTIEQAGSSSAARRTRLRSGRGGRSMRSWPAGIPNARQRFARASCASRARSTSVP